MKKPSISFILFAYNEEKRIGYAVKNFINYGPVFVLDGGSTDRTQEITEGLGGTFLTRPKSTQAATETSLNLDFIKSHIKTDWIYWGYCDNTAPKKLVELMCRLAEENVYKRVNLPMYTYLWGNTEHPAQRSHLAALFHKDFIDFANNPIHCFGKFLGTKEQDLVLPFSDETALRHFSTYNVAKYVAGYTRYAEEEAEQKFKAKERFKLTKLFAAMLRYLWIYRRALKTPKLGLLIMMNMAFGRLITYTRLYEYEQDITLDTIEDKYSKEKEKLLHEF